MRYSAKQQASWLRIGVSLCLLLFLVLLPLPKWIQWWQPQWLLLGAIYWSLQAPSRFGVFSAWTVGLLLDCVTEGLFGLNALAMAVIAYFVYLLHHRIRLFPWWQQCFTVFVLVGLYQTLMRVLHSLLGDPVAEGFYYYLSALISGLLWPALRLLSVGSARKTAVFN